MLIKSKFIWSIAIEIKMFAIEKTENTPYGVISKSRHHIDKSVQSHSMAKTISTTYPGGITSGL
jgi:hypothetical protein